jgi:hypothetical protein
VPYPNKKIMGSNLKYFITMLFVAFNRAKVAI